MKLPRYKPSMVCGVKPARRGAPEKYDNKLLMRENSSQSTTTSSGNWRMRQHTRTMSLPRLKAELSSKVCR